MKSKTEYIKSLNNVKLIIGNGFDLHCHMKTAYRDYFLYDEYKNNYFKKWLDDFAPKLSGYLNFQSNNYKDYWISFDHFDKTNIWDFFFYINSDYNCTNKEWRWCDIEDMILQWLKNREKTDIDSGKPHWENVYNAINNYSKLDYERESLMAAIVFKKHDEKRFKDINDFYMFLYQELKLFERNFGKYIYNLHFNTNLFGQFSISEKTNFNNYAIYTIKQLCDIKNLASIDSFNYDNIRHEFIEGKLHNINGDYENPIFGIDSNSFPASDIRYIFSKTNRRMELDMINDKEIKETTFDNLIVYGHSFNEADYSYFFSVFDKIKINDLTNKSKIVFAFSVYDKPNEIKIKSDYRTAISKMFYNYSIYLGRDKQPNRILDVLTSQGKVLMYEIDEINEVFY